MKLYGTMSVCKSYVASKFKPIASKGFWNIFSHLPQLQHFMSFPTGKWNSERMPVWNLLMVKSDLMSAQLHTRHFPVYRWHSFQLKSEPFSLLSQQIIHFLFLPTRARNWHITDLRWISENIERPEVWDKEKISVGGRDGWRHRIK